MDCNGTALTDYLCNVANKVDMQADMERRHSRYASIEKNKNSAHDEQIQKKFRDFAMP